MSDNDAIPRGEAGAWGALRERLRAAARQDARTPLPGNLEPGVRQVSAAEDLVTRFGASATAAGMRVRVLAISGAAVAIREVLLGAGATNIWIDEASFCDTPLAPFTASLWQALQASSGPIAAPADDDARFAAHVGITGVRAAVAETGSLLVTTGGGRWRGSSLIPLLHVALVHESQIVPDLLDLFRDPRRYHLNAANAVLITGPSKTADIEGVLITGVHGPREVHVLVLR